MRASSKRARTALRIAGAIVTMFLGLGLATTTANAGVGPSNNFGSDNTAGDVGLAIYLERKRRSILKRMSGPPQPDAIV